MPYQEAPDPPVDDDLRARCEDALYVVTPDGEEIGAGRGLIFIAERIGYGWVGFLKHPPFIWFVELGYRFMANNRGLFAKFFFRSETGGIFDPPSVDPPDAGPGEE